MITDYSIRYPFLIWQDEQDDQIVWIAEPFGNMDTTYLTCGDSLEEALKMAGDMALYIIGKLTKKEKQAWKACYDPERPNLYLVAPREYCVYCDEYDTCAPDCESDELDTVFYVDLDPEDDED